MSPPRPALSAADAPAEHVQVLQRAWRVLEVVGTLAVLLLAIATAMGWRIQSPADVSKSTDDSITTLQSRTTALEVSVAAIRSDFQTVIRLQCIGMTRREAALAGACLNYPTRDELARPR